MVHAVCHRGFLNISTDEKSKRLLLRLALKLRAKSGFAIFNIVFRWFWQLIIIVKFFFLFYLFIYLKKLIFRKDANDKKACSSLIIFLFCGSALFRVCLCYILSCLCLAALLSPDPLALLYVMFSCVLSLSHTVSWVRCGT